MSLRGARAAGARTVTSALFGSLRDDPAARAEFLALTRNRTGDTMSQTVRRRRRRPGRRPRPSRQLRERGLRRRRSWCTATSTHLPYERPPLSKGYLLGNDPLDDRLRARPPEWYDEHDVDLRLGTAVTAIDLARSRRPRRRRSRLDYDRLLLATGARPRHLAMADDSGAPVAYLRTIEDSHAAASRLRPTARGS